MFHKSTNNPIRLLKWAKVIYHRLGLRHVVLWTFYAFYLSGGAFVFCWLESDNQKSARFARNARLVSNRRSFVDNQILSSLFNNTDTLLFINGRKTRLIAAKLRDLLIAYERKLDDDYSIKLAKFDWTFPDFLLYAASLCTTIGYANFLRPMTRGGQIFGLFYTIFGIFFTLILLRDVGRLIAKLLAYPSVLLVKFWDAFRYITLKSIDTIEELKHERDQLCSPAKTLFSDSVLRIPNLVAILATIGYLYLGSLGQCILQPHLSLRDSFFSCFYTLTTVGTNFEVTPHNQNYFVFVLIYIFIGLAIFSLLIDLFYAKLLFAYTPVQACIEGVHIFPTYSLWD